MDLNDVTLFTRVVEAGTFTAAASSLVLPTSSVSRGVARLEASLGVRLLHRTTRRLRLTDAGHAFLEHARVALAELDQGADRVRALGAEVRGTVRLSASVDVGVHLLPPIVTRFVARHPHVRVEMSFTSRYVDLVEEGFDLAIRAGKLGDSTLVARRIGAPALGLFASKAYLARRGAPRSVADLAHHECLLFRGRGDRATWRFEGPDGERTVEVRGALAVDEMTASRELIAQGVGIGVLPTYLGATGRDLVRVLPRHAMAASSVAIVSPPVRYEPACVTLFREALAAELELEQRPGAARPQPRRPAKKGS
jgi:DNA-binding transcriptional LysR family regulator